MKVHYQLDEPQLRELHALYAGEWWSKGRSLEDTRACVERSQVNIALVNPKGGLVAYARVLTDYVFKALIFDVIVAKPCRGEGLGDRLMFLVRNHPELQQVRHFELYCRPENFPFYARHGYTTEVGETQLMRLEVRRNH